MVFSIIDDKNLAFKKNKYLHLLILVFFLFTLKQVYLFSEPLILNTKYFNKINSISEIRKPQTYFSYRVSDVIGATLFLESGSIDYTMLLADIIDNKQTNQPWLDDGLRDIYIQTSSLPNTLTYNQTLFNAIFTKSVYYTEIGLLEFFNFNNQLSLQPDNTHIINTLMLLLIILFNILF